MAFVMGLVVGAAVLGLAWFPQSVVEWFIASLIPGAIAFRLAQVPEDYSPPRAFGVFAGLWAVLFWVPIAVWVGQQLGVLH